MIKRIIALCILFLPLCADDSKIKVGVSVAPYTYFVEKIGGNFVEVFTLIPSARNPKFYEPNYQSVKQMKETKLLIVSGADYERRWLSRFRASKPSLQILNLSNQECSKGSCYSWLSFLKAKEIARKIAHQLQMLDLKNAQSYKKNLDVLLGELDRFEKKLKNQLLFAEQKRVFDHRGVWKQMADELGAKLIAEIEDLKNGICLITPFDIKKQIIEKYKISSKNLIELNPLKKDWMDLIQDFVNVLSGVEEGEKSAK